MGRAQKNAILTWERKLRKTLKTGKGVFQECLISEIHDYLKIIKVAKGGKFGRAYLMVQDLDTSARDLVPATIWDMLETAYYSE